MYNIMDGLFNGMSASEFYRAQVFPELFPHEKPMLINNWSQDDREMYCSVTQITQPVTAGLAATRTYTSSETRKEVYNG
jgi:hypothetical protein